MSDQQPNEEKKPEDLTPSIVPPDAGLIVAAEETPSYLMDAPEGIRTGDELSAQYAQPSLEFLKIVQGIGPLSMEFKKGQVLLMPEKKLICDEGQKLTCTPIYVYPEFTLRYHFKDKPDQPVKERTYDPNTDLAKKCEPWKKEEREIPNPDGKFPLEYRRYMIHALWIWELEKLLFLSLGGGEDETFREFKKLRDLRGKNKPICAQRYKMDVGVHPRTYNSSDKWLGFNFSNDERPWCTQEEFAQLLAIQDELIARHQKGTLSVIKDDATNDVGSQFT